MSHTFLTFEEVAELTGVRIGKAGRTREELQIDALRRMKVPHYVNAIGRPIVARAIIEGGNHQPMVKTWEPRVA